MRADLIATAYMVLLAIVAGLAAGLLIGLAFAAVFHLS